ncbi:MAG: MBL fold metallo-hydrolase [Candidatus Bruticola sp.]
MSGRCREFSLTDSLAAEEQGCLDFCSFLLDNLVLVYVLTTKQSALFIDSGWDEHLAEEVIVSVKKRWHSKGLTPQNFYLLNTHADWDHAWANRPFKRIFKDKLRIGASSATIDALCRAVEKKEIELLLNGKNGQNFSNSFIELPDTIWQEGDKVDLGGLEAEFIGADAHTSGQLGVLLPRFKVFWAGDMVEWPLPFPKNSRCLIQQVNELKRVQDLNLKRLYPAHIDNLLHNTNLAWNLCWGSGVLPSYNLHYILDLGRNIEQKLIKNHSLFRQCANWLASVADELGYILENENVWEELQSGDPLVESLLSWENEFQVLPEPFALEHQISHLNWFYQRAHHLFVLMHLRILLQSV